MSATRSSINSRVPAAINRSPNGRDTKPYVEVELVQTKAVDAGHARSACSRKHAHRGQCALRRHQCDRVTKPDLELFGQILTDQDRRRLILALVRERVEASLLHRRLDSGHRRLERRVDRLDADERLRIARDDERFAEDGRRGADDAWDLPKAGYLRRVVGDAACLPDVDVRLLTRILSRSSPWRPVISASAMTSAITPTVTPIIEISEMRR